MSETNDTSQSSAIQSAGDRNKITCHLVSLPKIILTRIDEGHFPMANYIRPFPKKPIKRLVEKKKTSTKTSVTKNLVPNNVGKKNLKRPKKENSILLPKASKKGTKNKVEIANKTKHPKVLPKQVTKNQSNVKNMLKKTMLQQRSKIAIPPVKKVKPASKPTNKVVVSKSKKQTPPKIKIDIPQIKPLYTDSSEDEFLYDELIEELENTPMKRVSSLQPGFEKTTNITLKPNLGNKPPTIVKGGIIKKVNLPADLKTVDSSNGTIDVKENVNTLQTFKDKPVLSVEKKRKLSFTLESPTPAKKPSPWPVSMSKHSPTTTLLEPNTSKNQKKSGASKSKNSMSAKQSKATRKLSKKALQSSTSKSAKSGSVELKPLNTGKNKIKPKQAAIIAPHSISLIQDDMSDEYTEEETLENIDSEPNESFSSKLVIETMKESKVLQENPKTPLTPSFSLIDQSKEEEDPHLDLLRILTDDSDEQIPIQTLESNEKDIQSQINNSDSVEHLASNKDNSSSVVSDASTELHDEPPVRTIYDVMSEFSLQYPSWNLHIIPETSAFCVAQVTKGRLGLPTLKKCIELDPVNYNAKVYIHQYHIKRFDGVYDSEESIIALIQEIDSIKA